MNRLFRWEEVRIGIKYTGKCLILLVIRRKYGGFILFLLYDKKW